MGTAECPVRISSYGWKLRGDLLSVRYDDLRVLTHTSRTIVDDVQQAVDQLNVQARLDPAGRDRVGTHRARADERNLTVGEFGHGFLTYATANEMVHFKAGGNQLAH